jgi:hypothetical protein
MIKFNDFFNSYFLELRFSLLELLEYYSEIFAALNEKKFQEININYMKKNIKHHRTLLRFCDEVTRTMGMFLMVKVGGQFFNIIFAAFSLITVLDSFERVGKKSNHIIIF